jgi:hypothetical protein
MGYYKKWCEYCCHQHKTPGHSSSLVVEVKNVQPERRRRFKGKFRDFE